MPPKFVHLRSHSDYSLGHGTSKVKDMVAQAAKLGQPALALTDENNLHAALEFSKAAGDKGVQPVVGVKTFLAYGPRSDTSGSIILLSQDDSGYANVCRLLNMALSPGRSHQGCLDHEQLQAVAASLGGKDDMAAGVIVLAGVGADGILSRILAQKTKNEGDDNTREARQTLSRLKSIFGDRLYVEVCRNGFPSELETALEKAALELAIELDLPIAGTTEAWYATTDRHDAYEILRAVASKDRNLIADEDGVVTKGARRYHLRDQDEMAAMFEDLPEARENTLAIARRCAFKAKGRKPLLPPFVSENGRSEEDELCEQARAGLQLRFDTLNVPEKDHDEYRKRLEYELETINKMGFPGYFLIVSDFIKYAKRNDIPVGPGRGSGAGSIAAWALEITDLDPLRFGLLFERFLNPERVSMPDFDIDFCMTRRMEVIQYVEQRYGRERVGQIVTFMEIKSKTAIRDVARVMAHPENGALSQREINELANAIPKSENSPDPKKLSEAYDSSPDFRNLVDASPQAKAVYANALAVEGLFRNSSAHAAGIIIAGDELTRLVPVGFDANSNFPIVQLNMKDSEKAGLVKFDFLGLATLTVIHETLKHIEMTRGERINLATIPLDDKPTFDMLSQGISNGVFQLESEGMKRVLKDIRPERLEDLIAVVSLYRPGPMDMIPSYARRKNGLEEPVYPEPREQTKMFLEETYGIMVYQEQVMLVSQVVAGYSLGEADMLRRAMGKKIKAEMDVQREKFVAGAVAKGTNDKDASALFDLIAKFAEYGFNKSHAAAYALITYQTAYLKRHYAPEFLAALLSNLTGRPDKMALVKHDLDHFDIRLLPPDVNKSGARFLPENGAVRLGLKAINGISDNVSAMVDERNANGEYKDAIDFCKRVGRLFNTGQLSKLAESGAFDGIAPGPRQRADAIVKFLVKNDKPAGAQGDLLGAFAPVQIPKDILALGEWPDSRMRERDSVGFYFNGSPLDRYQKRMMELGIKRRASIANFMIEKRKPEMMNRRLYGLVESCSILTGRNGKSFLMVRLAEANDAYDMRIYPRAGIGCDTDLGQLKNMLDCAMREAAPVTVAADFTLEPPDRVNAWGRGIWRTEQYLDFFPAPRSLALELDVLSRVTEEELFALQGLAGTAVDMGRETACNEAKTLLQRPFKEMVDDLRYCIDQHLGNPEAGTDLKFRLTIPIPVGPFVETLCFEMPMRGDLDNNALIALKSLKGMVSVEEISDEPVSASALIAAE